MNSQFTIQNSQFKTGGHAKFAFNGGFTLIETLVAISVLMVAIAGPLTIAARAYGAAVQTRNQALALNLAQEELEYLNAVKDDGTWFDNAMFADCGGGQAQYCGAGPVSSLGSANLDLDAPTASDINVCSNMNDCKLSKSASTGYSYRPANGNTSIDTGFIRRFVIQGLNNNQYMVTVYVMWGDQSPDEQLQLSQVMTKAMR